MNIDTSGPAFPVNGQVSISAPGMTLRDYFAAQAISAYLRNDGAQYGSAYKEHAEMAYAQADAMLVERSKP